MTRIQIITAPGCVHCGDAKRIIKSVVESIDKEKDITIEEIDLAKHPEIAGKYQLMSVPGIVIDGILEFIGVPEEENLRKKLIGTEKL